MPRKLGQHFLKDRRKLEKIAAALEIGPRDTIVEIGPGHGELTEHLVAMNPKRVIVIEKDPRLVNFLKEKFQIIGTKSQNIEIVEGDILKILPTLHSKFEIRNSKLVGNIPYYITGYLLRKISELEKKPRLIVFTIQKEVAERICTSPPKMNLLATSVQFWGTPKLVGYISKKFFRPPPKVDSAIIKITPNKKQPNQKNAEKYYRFIRILFKQPRKTILNNLREGFKLPQKEIEERLKTLRVSPKSRPANLSMSDINKLSAIFPQ
ncbi:MAG: 16S rRNA (adenine(1518)-N(6)/adenine(1519)-N(6))-dimethyltransferase RsmA [Candidatus Colwellbacteria bacterium]|nr:16S rRNA (adenine(1518)-N(6)/adenine(1519)-N(6))-dimethyltransferase RsmA [Candidatus Colwellbacteria bacterium]